MFIYKIKGYFSLISSILINLLNGNLLSFSNLIPYYHLYYKHNETERITLMQLYFIAPIWIFVDNVFPSFMGIIDIKLGIRLLTIFTTISLYISQIIIYFSVEYYLLIISYFIFGFGVSATYYQTVKNCWKYFPEKKDLMSGIIFSSFGLGSFVFTSIADYIINPDNIAKNGKYYSKVSCFIIIWNDSKTRDKNQINGFFQLDLIALKKFWWKIRTNLGPKTPRKKILIYLSKKYKKMTVD